MRHKHYDLILEWACGAEIEYLDGEQWINALTPSWYEFSEYRIKPEPKPDIVLYAHGFNILDKNNDFACMTNAKNIDKLNSENGEKPNIKLTYDGETNEFKDVEKI